MNRNLATPFTSTFFRLRLFCLVLLSILIGQQLFVAQPALAAPQKPAAASPITSYLDAEQAVFRIEVEGGNYVVLAEENAQQTRGGGTGFFINASGLGVTNNHVVTGAGVIRVYLGESSEPLNARILGSSECADLAVIQVVGDGFPYLTWAEEFQRGMDVYSIGFPFGTTEPTMNDGIISALHADGQMRWSSLDEILLHSAVINPGNSGGPLVNSDGEVVGVNYAQNSRNQYFAIKPPDAQSLIEQLQGGIDVDSIGIDGEAFATEKASGIWVRSVKAGSTADQAGIEAGDILLTLADLQLAADGTMHKYCDILRSHEATQTINVKLYRPSRESFCSGQLNGRELRCTEAPGIEYNAITDRHKQIHLETPTHWTQTKWEDWERSDRTVGIALFAAPDIEQYNDSWNSVGLTLRLSTELAKETTVDQELDKLDLSEPCTFEKTIPVRVGDFSGKANYWSNCSNQGTYVYHVVFTSQRPHVLGSLFFQGKTRQDAQIVDHLLETLTITLSDAPATPTPVPTPQSVSATILVASLNVRSGPGTNYPIIASASRNQQFTVIAQSGNCSWVMIRDRGGFEGWIAAGNTYARVAGPCGTLGSGRIVQARTGTTTTTQPQAGRNEGCLTFQNNLNKELNITFTGKAGQGNRNFQVAAHGTNRQCFSPGPYTYTLDAPPPFGSTNGSIDIARGMNQSFPVNAGN